VPPSDADEVARPIPNAAAASRRTSGDDYIGHDREVAKTSVAGAMVEDLASLQDLLPAGGRNKLPSDQFMRDQHDPPLREDPDFDRVDEEKRNLRVEAWIYGAKKETNDNDFHLLVASTSSESDGTNMMNMEITGLPENQFRAQLKVPRDAFKHFLGDQEPPTGHYQMFVDPIHVRITGSLFYDIDHKPGIVGTGHFKPHTAWEVHPITQIDFLDE
jgi:hypothetical protein